MHRILVIFGFGAAVAFGATGCATFESAERAAARAVLPPEEEKALGMQIHQELEQEGIEYVEDPVVLERVREIARPILQVAQKERPELDFHLHVVDNPDSINAFATPGGHIYIESGLLRAVDTEAELAGVIAHEAGHITGRHAARNMVQQFGIQTLAAIAVGKDPTQLEQLAAAIVGQGTFLAHSRSQELEADESGAVYASEAGYDPRGLISFFQTLQELTGETPRALTWFSTHPASEDRVAHLQEFVRERNLQASGGRDSLAGIQQRLGGPQGVGGAGEQR